MKKLTFLFLCLLFCSGCATYKYEKGAKAPYNKGYVVTRQNYMIPEYTVGKDNVVPSDLKLARERFKRRRHTVENYYKQMGLIENRFKQYVVNNMANMLKLVGGVFTLPYRAYEDYQYTHNKAYHDKIVRESEQDDAAEKIKFKTLRQELNTYIQDDLAKEPPMSEAAVSQPEKQQEVTPPQPQPESAKEAVAEPVKEAPVEQVKEAVQETAEVKPEAPVETPVVKEPEKISEPDLIQETKPAPVVEEPKSEAPAIVEEKKPEVAVSAQPAPKQQKSGFMDKLLKQLSKKSQPKPKPKPKLKAGQGQPKAIISAKPAKGISPLKVQFHGDGSYSKGAKIIAYEWDFGDGDKSTERNPVNTFWCKSFGTTQFNVTLTVKDTDGNTDTASAIVEVRTKPAK